MAEILAEAYQILADTTVNSQVNKIVAIARYRFRWSRKALFNFILETFPDLKDGLSERQIKFHTTSALYAAMDSTQKSKIIQRLEQIEKRNKKNAGNKRK